MIAGQSLHVRFPAGIEPLANSPENTANPAPGGAKNGALTSTYTIDPVLAALIDAWPKLPEAIRAGILAMVRAAGERADELNPSSCGNVGGGQKIAVVSMAD